MEPDVPSELDTTHNRSGKRGIEDSTELDHALVSKLWGIFSTEGELVATVLEVLAIGIVQGSNLTLDVAILLHRIADVVVLIREEGSTGHPRGKPTSKISCRKCSPGIQGHFGLKAYDLVAGVEEAEGSELSLITEIRIPRDIQAGRGGDSHGAEHLVRG